MTITVRKAGEAVVKAAAKAASAKSVVDKTIPTSVAAAMAAADPKPKITLRPPRAVTAEEAPTIQPARTSTETTMMPWRGWFKRWLQDNLSAQNYERMRNFFFFMPDDIYDLQQSPMPTKKIPISATDPTITHMYRYPSPGNQEAPNIPKWEATDDPYDSGFFKRDTRRRYLSSEMGNKELELIKLELMDQDDPQVQEQIEKVKAGPESSPGNQGKFATGPTDFDPTGLRATMSVTWEETEKSLDSHMPDHLPTPTWVGREQEVINYYESRNIPVPVGDFFEDLKVPVERRVARW